MNTITEFEEYKILHNFQYSNDPLKKWIDESSFSNLFKSDWGELMPVIDQISELGHEEIKVSEHLQDGNYLYWYNGDLHICISTIDSIYEEVLEFIKWYNLNK
jgi:hypothetical protein